MEVCKKTPDYPLNPFPTEVRPSANEILVSYPLPPAAYFIPPYQGSSRALSCHTIALTLILVGTPVFLPVGPTSDRPFLINVSDTRIRRGNRNECRSLV